MASKFGRKTACPCCVFLMDDLFLPPSTDDELEKTTAPSEMGEVPMEPKDAAKAISEYSMKTPILIFDSHGHAQLERDADEIYTLQSEEESTVNHINMKKITCAVAPEDWQATIKYSSSNDSILPALGVHPWYLDNLPDNFLSELEELLILHPSALVGEIGLCKMARFVRQHPEGKAVALQIQREVFKKQIILAAKLRRPVSVHCVNQHGVFVSVIKELIESSKDEEQICPVAKLLPPAIAMHSFTGTAHHCKELLKLEKQLSLDKPLFYFGFSHAVNYAMCTSEKSRRKGRDAVKEVPHDRLLVESDVHSSDDLIAGTAGAIAYVAWAREADLIEITNATSRNGLSFVNS